MSKNKELDSFCNLVFWLTGLLLAVCLNVFEYCGIIWAIVWGFLYMIFLMFIYKTLSKSD